MTTSTQTDPRNWRADTVDDRSAWYYPLSDMALRALERAVLDWKKVGKPITAAHATPALADACAHDLEPVWTALESGRGFATIVAGKPGQFSPEQLSVFYWLIGELLGVPVEQNVQGTLLYDVKDTGQDVRYGARFSVTNAESSFHTDNSFGERVLDYVGLLCLNTAKSGGDSQIVSSFAIRDELKAKHPEAWEILKKLFHIDRRGGLRPGDAPTVQFPVFAEQGNELVIRYLRYWIEVGHEKASVPLTREQVDALDTLDRIAEQPGLRAEFAMKPGEMLFINNRWVLHNRTAFEDYAEPERKRHLLRLWVERRTQASGTQNATHQR